MADATRTPNDPPLNSPSTEAPQKALIGSAADDADAIAKIVSLPEAAPALQALQREVIGDCQRCRLGDTRTNLVFGVGDPDAKLMFVGEGPGRDEDMKGEPFVGRAGKLLDKIIGAMGLSRAEVYIANIVKCRPPENRNPLPDESATCISFLEAQVRVIQPEVIVALGKTALEGLIGTKVPSITRARGQWFEYLGIPLKATFHPAYLLRSPSQKRPVWEDMQDVMKRLDLPLPGGSDG